MPVGAGGIRGKPALTVSSLRKRSLMTIQNDDNLCLPRALVVTRAYLTLKMQDCAATRKELLFATLCRYSRQKLQKERADKLVNDAGVFLPYGGCKFRELLAIQNFFVAAGIAIVVYEIQHLGNGEAPIFDGRKTIEELNTRFYSVIYLIFEERNRHFSVNINLFAVAGVRFFCSYFNKGYRCVDQHTCLCTCQCCFITSPCRSDNVEIIECPDCNRKFFGHECFTKHKRSGS